MIGCILLVMGLIVWLGIYVLQVQNPVHYGINGREYTGVAAYIRANHIELPYYLGIASIFIGAITIAAPYVLQWWADHSKD